MSQFTRHTTNILAPKTKKWCVPAGKIGFTYQLYSSRWGNKKLEALLKETKAGFVRSVGVFSLLCICCCAVLNLHLYQRVNICTVFALLLLFFLADDSQYWEGQQNTAPSKKVGMQTVIIVYCCYTNSSVQQTETTQLQYFHLGNAPEAINVTQKDLSINN